MLEQQDSKEQFSILSAMSEWKQNDKGSDYIIIGHLVLATALLTICIVFLCKLIRRGKATNWDLNTCEDDL